MAAKPLCELLRKASLGRVSASRSPACRGREGEVGVDFSGFRTGSGCTGISISTSRSHVRCPRPFERRDRDQLTSLVNLQVAAVIPGVVLSVNAVLSQLELTQSRIEMRWTDVSVGKSRCGVQLLEESPTDVERDEFTIIDLVPM